ncbi:MAG: hypothetical protein ACREA9_23250 [Pyrinomonadaceae bacterium]
MTHAIYIAAILLIGLGWYADRSILRQEQARYWAERCKYKKMYEFIDPIRWEADGFTYSERAKAMCLHFGEDMDAKELREVANAFSEAWKQKEINE